MRKSRRARAGSWRLDAAARLPECQHRVGRAKIDADGGAHAVARGSVVCRRRRRLIADGPPRHTKSGSLLLPKTPSYELRLGASEDPLTLSLSPQARLGELASQRSRIRKRMRLGERTLRTSAAGHSGVPSPLGEKDRMRGGLGSTQPDLVITRSACHPVLLAKYLNRRFGLLRLVARRAGELPAHLLHVERALPSSRPRSSPRRCRSGW